MAEESKTRRWVLMALAGVILVGALLRLHALGRDSLWYDEAYVLFEVSGANPFSSLLDPTKGTEPPLFPALVKGWNAVIESVTGLDRTAEGHDFLLRLLPCLMGILAIALVYLVSKAMLDDDWAAVAAAFLYALSPYHVYYAQELRNYTFCTVLWLLAALFYFRALRTNETSSWAASGACLAVSMYTHFFSAWVIVIFGLHFLVNAPRYRDKLGRWILLQVVLFIAILPTLILARMIMGYFDNIGFPWYPNPTLKTALVTFKTFFAGYAPDVWAYRGVFSMAAVLVVLGMVRLCRNWPALSFLGLMTLVPVGANAIMWGLRDFPLYEHRLFVFSGVTACLLVAYGVRMMSRAWVQLAVLAIFTAFTIPCLQSHYANRLHAFPQHNLAIWDKVDLRGAAAYVNVRARPGDVLGHSGHYSWFPLNYYSPIEQHILGFGKRERDFMVTNFGHPDIVKHFRLEPVDVRGLAQPGRRLWFIETFGRTFDYRPTAMLLREWLEAHCIKEDVRVFDGVVVTCYRSEVGRESAVVRNRIYDSGGPVLADYSFGEEAPADTYDLDTVKDALAKYPVRVFSLGVDLTDAGKRHGGQGHSGAGHDEVVVRNASAGPLELEVSVLESAHTVEPMDLDPVKPGDSVWALAAEYCQGAPQTLALTPSWVASMGTSPCADDVLQASVAMHPGLYTVFVRCLQAPAETPEGRGQAIVEVVGSAFRATVPGVSEHSESGWRWNRLGNLDWPGGIALISISPSNIYKYSECYFDLGQVAFVAHGPEGSEEPLIRSTRVVTLGPSEERTVTLEIGSTSTGNPRTEIVAQDPISKEIRRVILQSRFGEPPVYHRGSNDS